MKDLSSELHGYTGADIKSLCREAALKSIRRYLPEIDLETEKIPSEVLQSMQIKLIDFYEAMQEVIPTAMREAYLERSKARIILNNITDAHLDLDQILLIDSEYWDAYYYKGKLFIKAS